MKIFPLLFCLLLTFAFAASAQSNPDSSCPQVEVRGGGVVEFGASMSFTAKVEGYDLRKLSFRWTVSNGTILEGQETPSITVSNYKSGENTTATVEIKGLPEGCANTASDTGLVHSDPVLPRLIDEFGALPNGELRARIDAFFIVLGNEPNAQGYIINYGTKREITNRETLFRNFIASRRYDTSRITFIRGGANPKGERGVRTKFWIVPPGAVPPTPEDEM